MVELTLELDFLSHCFSFSKPLFLGIAYVLQRHLSYQCQAKIKGRAWWILQEDKIKETGVGGKIESGEQKRQRNNAENKDPFFHTAAIS